jgi:hypothetical protein
MFERIYQFIEENANHPWGGRMLFAIISPFIFLIVIGLIFADSFSHNFKRFRKLADPNELVVEIPSDINKQDITVTWNLENFSPMKIYEKGEVVNHQFKEKGNNNIQVFYRGTEIAHFLYTGESDTDGHDYLIRVTQSDALLKPLLFIDGSEIESTSSDDEDLK